MREKEKGRKEEKEGGREGKRQEGEKYLLDFLTFLCCSASSKY